ncbi:transglycosylase SLT domain-containing protein [Aquicella lusitana]|nr:transglycosylase SLT domain-containing protein [Aquicella lusitana]
MVMDPRNTTIMDITSTNTNIDESAASNPDETVWDSLSREFKLDHKVQTAQVQAEIRKLLADQNKLYQILTAAAPYIYFIQQQTQARGLPGELALIPFIESEFNPNDHSNKGATGLWQLMSGTARELGVKVKAGYDGRRNVVASTKAALAYFKDLGNNFNGNWYLAIAAYNCGQVKVESAVRRTGSKSFWNLPLPKETKYYVPKLLAVAEIVENPQKYGVALPAITNQPYFTAVKVDKAVNLTKLAKSSGINIKTLNTLNPDYKQGTVPKGKDSTLLVPIKKASVVQAQLGKPKAQTA